MKFIKTLILATMLFFVITNLNGAWWANEIPCPYPYNSQCESLIAQGASNFMQSFSSFYLLLNESELNSNSSEKSTIYIENTINKLIASKENLSQFLSLLKEGTIDPDTIQKLKSFNYESLVAMKKLHPVVMDRVKYFLTEGNLNGFLEEIISDLDIIINNSINIQNIMRNKSIPNLDDLRELFQKFSDCMLLGYYSSLVFSDIK
jgi:hypothetical protein